MAKITSGIKAFTRCTLGLLLSLTLSLSFSLSLSLSLSNSVLAAGAAPIHTSLDISKAPDAADYGQKSQALIEEWYPRINVALFGEGHPLPFDTVHIIFEPVLVIDGAAAYAEYTQDTGIIHVSSKYIQAMPDDFRAMMIHELSHLNQHYPPSPPSQNAGWLIEGIADYVRHKYFERDIQPLLQLDAQGKLSGYTKNEPYFYSLEHDGTSLEDHGYMKAYTVASTFLYWLETRKNKDIVQKLNLALSQGDYSDTLFKTYSGETLDRLWRDFVAESKARRGNPAS
ncbi:basic secretory protein-like protein [Undibacterium sp.]|uniref:basic secretory protein-like protein n=1 Tax=Undibacterium sp. TaxID=1914977 RepID=UPI00374D93DA